MSEQQRIRSFLRAIRRRALLEASVRIGGATVAAAVLAVLLLALLALRIGPAGFWPKLTVTVLTTLALGGLLGGLLGPVRRLRSERRVALLVGRRHPPLASDLLSAVELGTPGGLAPDGSAAMEQAFFGHVADATAALDVRRIVPFSRALAACALLLLMGGALGASLLWLPETVGKGLATLLRRPTRFEGAVASAEPLFGDAKLVYTYPAYTKLPVRTVEGSTGDIVALKGTRVEIEAPLMRRAREALLLLGDAGEGGELPARIEGGRLHAAMEVRDGGSYRVWLSPLIGRPVREVRPHRIIAEADQPPRVEIQGPADRLELPTPRPVEVGFSATDDFGLGPLDLVYRVGDQAEQRLRLREGGGTRGLQGRTMFEPTVSSLRPGETVAYHIEARDNDQVSGAKVGTSRTLYIVIQNPRENLDEQLQRERDILDKMIANLADRLEILDTPLQAVAPVTETTARLGTWMAIHEAEEGFLAGLGRVIDDERRAGSASKSLLSSLAGMADKLGKHLRAEGEMLMGMRGRADQGTLVASHFVKLQADGSRHAQELETSVLLLDDLIGRQRLEDLAALVKELTDAHKRLQDLLQRYLATKDEALRRQIEREIHELRARIDELASKIAAVKARNEVPAEWQNLPDLKEVLEKTNKLDQLLDKGDAKSLQDALAELGDSLKSLQQMLDKNASDFSSDRFPKENPAAAELMKKIGDLEGDERALAEDGKSLSGEMDAAVTKKLQGKIDDFINKMNEKIDRLRGKLAAQTPRELPDDTVDDFGRAQDGAKQLRRLLPQKEWGEAKREAERIVSSLRRVRRSVDERKAGRKQPSQALDSYDKDVGEAGAVAQEIAADLDKLVPRAGEQMSPEQRDRSKGMGERQGSLQGRAKDLAQEAGKKAGQIPGMEKAEPELRRIGDQMGEASQDLSHGNPKEGSTKAKEAADRLAQLRDQMRNERQMGRGHNRREPVRIPGADDSKAPREWRQELLEAMREKAPERFRDEVRRYYESLVK